MLLKGRVAKGRPSQSRCSVHSLLRFSMGKGRLAWRASSILFLLVRTLLVSCLLATASSTFSDPVSHCIRSSPRHYSRDQSTRLCIHAADGLDDGPALCAASALHGSPSGFTATHSADVIDAVIDLCDRAADTRPAQCWTSAMTSQNLRSTEWRKALTAVCKLANDTLPAQCMMEFKRHGLEPTKGSAPRQAESPMEVGVEICTGFHGDTSAIGMCLSRAPRSISEASRYRLCRQGNASAVADVLDCAKQLLQRNTKPEIVVDVCATATKPRDQPQACVLAAQQQVRWMDDARAVAHLCRHSPSTAAPVECAAALRSWFIAQFSKEHPVHDLAQLCHGAVDAVAIADCVKKLPNQLFRAEHIVRLCAHNEASASRKRAECVVNARQQLIGVGFQYVAEDATSGHDEQADLLLELCEDAAAPFAPLECLTSTATQHPPFSSQQRVRLCQRAASAAPHLCYRAIQASLLARLPNQTVDGIELCREATSIAPATCANLLQHNPADFFHSGLATELCKSAASASPAECYHAAPKDFTDQDKIELCAQASSDEPAACAKAYVPRLGGSRLMAKLCAKATSRAPAQCAGSSPYGMSPTEIISLCREATDDKPAQCARAIPPNLRIPWQDVAAVCRTAASTTPGSCLAHRVRQRVSLNQTIVSECRSMVPIASTVEIVEFTYECEELMPRCPITLKARVLDQFAYEMPAWSNGYVYFTATADGEDGVKLPILRGVTVAPIMNGTVLFQDLQFTEAGNFTLRLSSPGVEDMVARVHVRINETEKRERDRCERVFSFMECAAPRQPFLVNASSSETDGALQILRLRNALVLVGLPCESMWTEQHAGLKALASVHDAKLFALPRMAYQLLTDHDIPSVAMSLWERLGIPEGSNRSTIRRAYHKRSLEWHPDKWPSVTGGDTATIRRKLEAVYAHINDAYQQLLKSDDRPSST